MFKAIWHRPVQACVIVALSAVVTTCAVLTPLYERALEQASVTVALDHAPPAATQVRVSSVGILPDSFSGSAVAAAPLSTDQLEGLVPSALRRSFESPIPAQSVVVGTARGAAHPSQGALVSRAGACAHLALQSGVCPRASGEVLVSTADARNFGWQPGTRVPMTEVLPLGTPVDPTTTTLVVTGTYRAPTTTGYWGGWQLTGSSGTQPDRQNVAHDTLLTGASTFNGSVPWNNPVNLIDLPVKRRVIGIDQLRRLGPAVAAFQRDQARPATGARVQVESGLESISKTVDEGRRQARATVPALMFPLGILGLVVLWMALGAAAEQRRPEVAIARLRGRGAAGARAHLLRELLTIVLAGVPLGVAAALGLDELGRHLVLPGGTPLELRLPVGAALLASVLAVTATTVVVAARLSREPIAALLRRVPARRTGWALGTSEAVVVAVAGSMVVALVSGRLTGPVALAAPAVVALALGVVTARVAASVASRAGGRMLARGRPASGVALLQLARRRGTASIIALLTVAAGILVFAGNAVAVGARNRELSADQQVGAPMVASVQGASVPALRDALASLGAADQLRATPVVIQHALAYDDQTNLYVDPEAFGRIASMPQRSAVRRALRALAAPHVQPITLTGTQLTADLSTTRLDTGSHPAYLSVRLLDHDGTPESVLLGRLSPGTSPPKPVQARVDCAAGCTLTGWDVATEPANPVSGIFTVASVHTERTAPVGLGAASDWAVPDPAQKHTLEVASAAATSLGVQVDNAGLSNVVLQHRWVPLALPAVVTGSLPQDATGTSFKGSGLDGKDTPMTQVATLPWLPRAGRKASLSSLELAARAGLTLSPDAEVDVWFATADRGLLGRVTKALERQHLSVVDVTREARVSADLRSSPSAWSLQLGVFVGVACLVVAALALAIAGAATWRARARDLAVLRMGGMTPGRTRRLSVSEQLPLVVVAVLAGAASGVLAAHFTLPTLPLLPSAPPVDLLDLSISWGWVLALTVVALVALSGVGWLIGRAVSQRATLDRVVEST